MRHFLVLGSEDHILDQVARGLRAAGYESHHPGLQDYVVSVEEFKKILEVFPADVVITRNRRIFDRLFNPHGMELHAYIVEQKIPYICWFLEMALGSGGADAVQYFYGKPYPYACNLIFARDVVEEVRALGHQAYYLPNAFTAQDHIAVPENPRCDVSFIGQAKVLIDETSKNTNLVAHYRGAVVENLKSVIKGFFENIFQKVATQYVEDAVLNTLRGYEVYQTHYNKMAAVTVTGLAARLETRCQLLTSRYILCRYLQSVEKLDVSLHLHGGEGWKYLAKKAEVFGSLPRDQLAQVYATSTINLALSKWELGDSVHERVFNMAGTRSFQLAEHRDSIRELYNEDEIVTFRSPEELQAQIRHFLAHPQERIDRAEAAYKKTCADHTYPQRMEQLVALVVAHMAQAEIKALPKECAATLSPVASKVSAAVSSGTDVGVLLAEDAMFTGVADTIMFWKKSYLGSLQNFANNHLVEMVEDLVQSAATHREMSLALYQGWMRRIATLVDAYMVQPLFTAMGTSYARFHRGCLLQYLHTENFPMQVCLTEKTTAEWFGKCAICVIPHPYEIGDTVPEALYVAAQHGACVVIEESPAITKLFPKNILLRYRSYEALAGILRKLLGDPALRKQHAQTLREFLAVV